MDDLVYEHFGEDKDLDTETLLNLHGESLFSACSANSYTRSICTPWFWQRKWIKEYKVPLLPGTNYQRAYNQMYIRDKYEQLLWATKHRYTGLVEYLLINHHYFTLWEARNTATLNKDLPTLKVLFKYSVPRYMDGNELRIAVGLGYAEILEYIISWYEKNMPDRVINIIDQIFPTAVMIGNISIIKILLDHGAPADKNNNSLMMMISPQTNMEVVQLLRDYGVRI